MFTADELKRINMVLDSYQLEAETHCETQDLGNRLYDNLYGCGNCGDMSPTEKTIYNLRARFNGESAQ